MSSERTQRKAALNGTPRASDSSERLQDLVYAISDIQRLVTRMMIKETLRENLTLQQSAVLRILLNGGPMQMNRLSRELLTTAANVTSLIDRMEKKGLVERAVDRGDRRKIAVQLTPDGKKIFETAAKRYRDHVEDTLDVFTATERRELLRLLEKLRDELSRRETVEP